MIITRTVNGEPMDEKDLNSQLIKHPIVLKTVEDVRKRLKIREANDHKTYLEI